MLQQLPEEEDATKQEHADEPGASSRRLARLEHSGTDGADARSSAGLVWAKTDDEWCEACVGCSSTASSAAAAIVSTEQRHCAICLAVSEWKAWWR